MRDDTELPDSGAPMETMRDKYRNGIQVMEGDVVGVLQGGFVDEGVVIKLFVPNGSNASDGSAPAGGVFIEGGAVGLFFTESPEEDEDIVFVHRREKIVLVETAW